MANKLVEWRRNALSKRVLKWYRKMLPPISDTEQAAIDAGTVWWDGELFSGKPDWQKLRDYPNPALSEEENAFLDGPTEQLCAMLSDWEIRRGVICPTRSGPLFATMASWG